MKHISLPKLPVLKSKQIERLSNIFDNAGQVILGAVVFSPIISGVDKNHYFIIVLGILGFIACWILSLWFAKKGEEK